MNPHAPMPTSFASMVRTLWTHKRLILQMTRREVVGRYKGSVMGLLWSFLNPLLMLVVYTFVFSVVFKAKWGGTADESRTQFAVVLFAGLIVHLLFAEILNRSPALILQNVNYVKKVVFPLETLVAICAGSALFHAMVSAVVLFLVFFGLNGYLPWTVIFLPLTLVPLLILALGIGWIFASLGVFARDLGQVVGVLTTILQFLSPIFFPLNSLPPTIRPWVMLNPLTFIIEQTREVAVWGHLPNFSGLLVYMICASLFAWLGYAWFQKTRKGFADVL